MDGDERAHLHDDLPETGLRSEVGLQAREAQLDGDLPQRPHVPSAGSERHPRGLGVQGRPRGQEGQGVAGAAPQSLCLAESGPEPEQADGSLVAAALSYASRVQIAKAPGWRRGLQALPKGCISQSAPMLSIRRRAGSMCTVAPAFGCEAKVRGVRGLAAPSGTQSGMPSPTD